MSFSFHSCFFFFFNDTATTEIYTLSLHDALPISLAGSRGAWRSSRHSDGRITRTRIHEGVLDPNEIVSLGVGRAAVIVLANGPDVRIARIFSTQRHR